ncbi:MAG TPA: DNA polymerase III subunit alpha [Syntrophales bacterium]|nr:DNA polymerase III subunit alpha [Syntrophales bacterium]
MKHADFVHLHVHSQYSLLDGMIRFPELFERAKQYAMPAVALSDHGNMFGVIEFYQQAFKHGIKPIIGCELYVAPGRLDEKNAGAGIGESARHLLVLVKNLQGYKNLMKLTTAAYLKGFYYRPRVDKALLREYHEGLIAMSACLHGEIPSLILSGDMEDALRTAEEYRDIFGRDNFYLEIMENGLPEQKVANDGLKYISEKLGLPLVATNDCHYLRREDAEAHDVLLCIQTGKTVEDKERLRFRTDQFYFRSPEEMKELFRDTPEAITRTVEIAERCNLILEFGQIYLPNYPVESGKTVDEELESLAWSGLSNRLSQMPPLNEMAKRKYKERLKEELAIIKSMGFSGYFLIVADFINYAKRRNIPVGPGRGSAAGSLVAYAIGITNIDPIRYGLFFERFLNPDRKSMPDIDTDFCPEGRDEIIRYVTEKYGENNVAQIITFGKMQAKAVIRDVGRALNIPYAEVDAIAKLVPGVLNITLDEALQMEPRLRQEAANNEKINRLISLSRALEGLARHSSTHAAGVVISDLPLVERVPLCRSPRNEIVTQYSMNDLAAIGLTKFDFLGLKTLTMIKNVKKMVEQGRGISIDLDRIPLDDGPTYELLQKGDTDGIFQLESAGMRDILINMKPDCIEDLIALIALYRPGPMEMVPDFISRKLGKTKITYIVPQLEPILKETYGIILYQEQVMQIANLIGNYTMAEADNLRKSISKKIAEVMDKERPKFLAGAKANKISADKAEKIWEYMERFAKYGFNKSHSTAYAIISYQTAYLKAHYPLEFMAALLSSEKDNRDKIIKYITSCKEKGINVFPPDINESLKDFTVAGGSIRFGLEAVKNVGAGAVEAIIQARNELGGKFNHLSDFFLKVDLKKVNKRVIESLIKCGAFDSLGYNRRQLALCYEQFMELAQNNHKKGPLDQVGMFDHLPAAKKDALSGIVVPDVEDWDAKEKLAFEKELLGFFITGHPLWQYRHQIVRFTTADASNLSEKKDREMVVVVGLPGTIREVTTKKKEVMAHLVLEDLSGTIKVILFPEVYRRSFDAIHGEDPIVVKGTVSQEEESTKVLATEVITLRQYLSQNGLGKEVHLYLDSDRASEEILLHIKGIARNHKGEAPVFLHLASSSGEAVISLGEGYRLKISNQLKLEVEKTLGPSSISWK